MALGCHSGVCSNMEICFLRYTKPRLRLLVVVHGVCVCVCASVYMPVSMHAQRCVYERHGTTLAIVPPDVGFCFVF